MKTKNILLLGVLAMMMISCGDDNDIITPVTPTPEQKQDANNTNRNQTTTTPDAWRLEFPKLKGTGSVVIVHKGVLNNPSSKDKGSYETGVNYSVEWDTNMHAQRWSCYQMYANISYGNVSRYSVSPKGSLTPDSQYPNDLFLLNNYQFTVDPYWNSGYDHGHICPSADRLGAYEANYQTFFLTNMHPQRNAFNAGLWEKMESQVRTWNRGTFRDTLYVCKGGTIDSETNIIKYIGMGINKIPVPKYFYMAVLCKNSEGYKALGFWVEHKNEDHSMDKLGDYVVNIDELEQKTGIDFFCNLPDNIENQIEALAVDNVKRAWGLN